MKEKDAVLNYLKDKPFNSINLKAVLFDMDGVLFDSMKYHARSWSETLMELNVDFSPEEVYLHEGRTGEGTINIAFKRTFGRTVTKEEAQRIYEIKARKFNQYATFEVMSGAVELLQKVTTLGLQPILVTGSGQKSLLDKLNTYFPGVFREDLMVTALDVQHGKPNPEPYLMGLQKGGYQPWEAIVVENAPLGVEAGHRAGLFTVAVNTGPLKDTVLSDAGADLIYKDMLSLDSYWMELNSALKTIKSV